MLYPRESEKREVKDLSGLWQFKLDKNNEGLNQQWYKDSLKKTIVMPVPSSYNDITQDIQIRDHIGDVWYERTFFVPIEWQTKRVALRVGSATHHAKMWVNGIVAAEHKGGFLPFEADIAEIIMYGKENRVTIMVNNILDWTTLPPGEIMLSNGDEVHPKGYKIQEYFHDFYNYAGIHRPVKLIVTPKVFISDITIKTDIEGNAGVVEYKVEIEGAQREINVYVLDRNSKQVASSDKNQGKLNIKNAQFWEPGNAYLYTFLVETKNDNKVEDYYRLPIGIRKVQVTEKEFLINGKPFYFKGFGKHEDMDIQGKGLNEAVNVKDFNLLKWINANSFRTSHYPYAEEIMNLADQEGIVIIDEVPAVGMNWRENCFSEDHIGQKTLEHHLQVMRELITRDKNHPSVVMWSVANEAATHEKNSAPYFKTVAEETRKLDSTRPITIVNSSKPEACYVAQYFDVICVNRYFGWYNDPGKLDLIEYQLEQDLLAWHKRFQKPVFVTEYGADTINGLHQDPPVMFTEEFQIEFLKHYHQVFDRLPFIIGEHVWNFADFATKQGINRVIGNRKGVFTRQRQPKMAAHLLKERWGKK